MEYVVSILIGYCLGCFNLAYILGKNRGFDIRQEGSKNAGASNTAVTIGYGAAVIVAVTDILKAFAAALICKSLYPESSYIGTVAAVAAVFGHIYPFWLGFRGGKGLACFMGMILATSWKEFIVFGIAIITVTLVTNYIALGTISVIVSYPIYMFIVTSAVVIPAIVGIASVVMLYKHVINIRRIINGEEIGLRSVERKL